MMMNGYVRIVSLILLCILLPGCADKLTRPEAYRILKESVEPSLPQAKMSFRTDVWVPESDTKDKVEQLLALQFFEALQEEGFLSKPTTRSRQRGWTPGTDYFFRPIQRQDVEPSQEFVLNFNMSKGTFHEVTGILSEGPSIAEAECVTIYAPTQTFKTINSYVVAYRQQGQRWLSGYLFSDWPEVEQLYVKETRRYRFRKYDDGWRVGDFLGASAAELVPQSPEELASASVPVSLPGQANVATASDQEAKWEVPSLGSYSDGFYQLELWRDRSANGQVIGLITLFSENASVTPSAGELAEVTGGGEQGPLRFTSRLASGELAFDGVMRNGVVEGLLRSAFVPEGRRVTFDRIDPQYEKNYATKNEWAKERDNLLSCCGPDASPQ